MEESIDEEPKPKESLNEEKTETAKDEINGLVNKVVFPGDIVGKITDFKIRLGPGLLQNGEYITATKCGVLRNPITKYFWIENQQKRYVPAQDDMVIGVVKEKHADNFKVDIGSASISTLPALSFEGATKKNRPPLQVGSAVYARVVLANKDMEPELSCVSVRGKAEGYGELTDGYLFKCSLNLCYQLLDDNCPVLKALGKIIPYEIAVGMNGRVWVNAATPKHSILVTNAIINSEFLKATQLDSMIQRLLTHFS